MPQPAIVARHRYIRQTYTNLVLIQVRYPMVEIIGLEKMGVLVCFSRSRWQERSSLKRDGVPCLARMASLSDLLQVTDGRSAPRDRSLVQDVPIWSWATHCIVPFASLRSACWAPLPDTSPVSDELSGLGLTLANSPIRFWPASYRSRNAATTSDDVLDILTNIAGFNQPRHAGYGERNGSLESGNETATSCRSLSSDHPKNGS